MVFSKSFYRAPILHCAPPSLLAAASCTRGRCQNEASVPSVREPRQDAAAAARTGARAAASWRPASATGVKGGRRALAAPLALGLRTSPSRLSLDRRCRARLSGRSFYPSSLPGVPCAPVGARDARKETVQRHQRNAMFCDQLFKYPCFHRHTLTFMSCYVFNRQGMSLFYFVYLGCR